MVSENNSTEEQLYISFLAGINQHTTDKLIAVMADMANKGKRKIYLMLNTSGGSVAHGMSLYNILKGLPITLTTHNVGSVDSIGNIVFLAGEKRYACPSSTFMFHGVTVDVPSNTLGGKILQENLNTVLIGQKRMGQIIADHTDLNTEKIASLFNEQQIKDADFAHNNGFIHEIRDVNIPSGSPVASLVFQD